MDRLFGSHRKDRSPPSGAFGRCWSPSCNGIRASAPTFHASARSPALVGSARGPDAGDRRSAALRDEPRAHAALLAVVRWRVGGVPRGPVDPGWRGERGDRSIAAGDHARRAGFPARVRAGRRLGRDGAERPLSHGVGEAARRAHARAAARVHVPQGHERADDDHRARDARRRGVPLRLPRTGGRAGFADRRGDGIPSAAGPRVDAAVSARCDVGTGLRERLPQRHPDREPGAGDGGVGAADAVPHERLVGARDGGGARPHVVRRARGTACRRRSLPRPAAGGGGDVRRRTAGGGDHAAVDVAMARADHRLDAGHDRRVHDGHGPRAAADVRRRVVDQAGARVVELVERHDEPARLSEGVPVRGSTPAGSR